MANAAEPVGPKVTPRLKELITEEMQLINGASAEVFQAIIALVAESHGAAAKLAEVARAQDVAQELALFAQMTETCVTCHGTYSSDRFPALATE